MTKKNEMTTTEQKSTPDQALIKAIEQAVTTGNLALLNPEQKLYYYKQVCASVGLNPMTRPLDFLNMQGKIVLYAKKDATEQLRKIHTVSIVKVEREVADGLCIVTAYARDKDGKEDCDVGSVPLPAGGEARANAIMKALTKAKRRVTLSICGLGLLDESELDGIPDAAPENFTLGAQTQNQVAAMKEKFTAPPPAADTPPPVPAAAKSAAKEPEVLPPEEKAARKPPGKAAQARAEASAKAEAPPAAVPAEPIGLGDTVVPFGPVMGKKFDALTDQELHELVAYTNGLVNKGSGPRVLAFKRALDEYAPGFGNVSPPAPGTTEAAASENDPAQDLMDLNYDGPPPELLAPDYKKIAMDRIRAATNETELRTAWSAFFADAKDPNKLNLGALPPDESKAIQDEFIALREECKKKLGVKTAPVVPKK